jgi:putative membrane protein
MLRALASALHLLALVVGLAGVFLRGRAMRAPFDDAKRDALLVADNAWGIAALLWIATGLWRLFGETDKPTSFYLASHAFHLKITLFVVVFLLELAPMVTFVKWRIALAKGQPIDTSRLATFRVTNTIQVGIVITMILVAAAMARGIGYS